MPADDRQRVLVQEPAAAKSEPMPVAHPKTAGSVSRSEEPRGSAPGSGARFEGFDLAGDETAVQVAGEQVDPSRENHDSRDPSPELLRSRTFLGNVKAEGEMDEITSGSRRIVEVLLDDSDPRPIWIQGWGGTNTIARPENDRGTAAGENGRGGKKIRFYFI